MSADFEYSPIFHEIMVVGEGGFLHGTDTSIREAKKIYTARNLKRTVEVYNEAGKLIWRKEAKR